VALSFGREGGAMAVGIKNARRAFTLVELLVVISIIGMLMALLLPAVQQAREAGRSNTCRNNLRNCTLAVLNFSEASRKYPGFRQPLEVTLPGGGSQIEIPVGWVVKVLPYLERRDIYAVWRDPQGAAAANIAWPPQAYLEVLNCPSSPPPSTTNSPCVYVVNSGMDDQMPTDLMPALPCADFQANGVFFNQYVQSAASAPSPFTSMPNLPPIITMTQDYISTNDGTSMTLMMSENNNVPTFAVAGSPPQGLSGGPSSWGDPTISAYEKQNCFIWWPDRSPDPAARINARDAGSTSSHYYYYFLHPASAHPGGVNVSFCDGHVRFLSEDIDYFVFCLLMTPNGAKCNTPGTFGGLDGSPGATTPWNASFYYPSGTNNYTYLRSAPLNESQIP
jgi:prepilin-type N-terminal cleavage/methylation domain-containing protein/prepilin-type processing-associated H-X9-DG protein